MEYEAKKQIRIIDFDNQGRIKISSLLSIMQEAADEHTKSLALNNANMIKSGYAWILTRQGVKVYKQNGYGGEIIVSTGALPSKSIEFPREYILSTSAGEPIAYSLSYWSVLDIAERRLVRATDVPNYAELLIDKDADMKFAKLRAGKEDGETEAGCHTVVNCEIDMLGHLNNTFYPDIAYNALNSEEFAEEASEFNITYVKEAKLGERIALYKACVDNAIRITGRLDGGETCFIAEIKK